MGTNGLGGSLSDYKDYDIICQHIKTLIIWLLATMEASKSLQSLTTPIHQLRHILSWLSRYLLDKKQRIYFNSINNY